MTTCKVKKSLHPFHILKEVFDLLPDAVLVVDEHGKIMLYNHELSALLGYSAEELLSMGIETVIPEKFRDRHAMFVSDFFNKKNARKMAAGLRLYALKKDNTEVQVDIALSPYEVFGTSYTIAVIRELSEKQYLEEKIGALERTKEELERFACVVSHDLKAPVKRIHVLVDLILKELPAEPGGDLQMLIKYLRQSIYLTEKLIAGILEQARTEHHVDAEELDLNEILSEVQKGMVIPSNFQINVPQPLPSITGNRTQWIQVFMNLITNAIKYNDKPQGMLEIKWSAVKGFTVLNFADNGTVVSDEKRNSIFQMFFRGEDQIDGASHGIGLSIVKKITDKAGGKIQYAESKLGGSEFIIYWPH